MTGSKKLDSELINWINCEVTTKKDLNGLSIYHVGGRSGSRGFPIVKSLEKEIASVIFDADNDCIDQIIERTANSENQTIVIPFGLSDKKAIVNLYMTYDPNMSSLLKPLSNVNLSYPYPNSDFDYDLREALQVVEVREVEVISLDELLSVNKQIPQPIFLSLDTQGSELQILKGAKSTLKNVVAVLVEVNFVPIYEGQASFGEINEFLHLAGFQLYDIYKGTPTTNSIGPVGTRAKGALSWGDALFFKNPNNADKSALAFCALAFGYSDLARECFPIKECKNPELSKILKDFAEIINLQPNNLPSSFAQLYTESESKKRYFAMYPQNRKNFFGVIKKKIKEKRHFFMVLFIIYKTFRIVFSALMTKKLQLKKVIHKVNKKRIIFPLLKFSKRYGFDNLKVELLKNLND